MTKDSFERYSSKVKRINIPLPSFTFVHKSWFPRNIDNSTPGYIIGRDRIIEKLKSWLTKEKTNGGVYLVTGYRGMGKTSFVNRVLFELVGEPGFRVNFFGFVFLIIAFSLILFMPSKDFMAVIPLLGISLSFLWCICHYYKIKEKFKKYKFRLVAGKRYVHGKKDIKGIISYVKAFIAVWKKLEPKEWDRINNLIYGSNEKYKKYSHISININLGQEILDERNILCVLTSQLYKKYRNYILSPIANAELFVLYILSSFFVLLFTHFHNHDNSCELSYFRQLINNVSSQLPITPYYYGIEVDVYISGLIVLVGFLILAYIIFFHQIRIFIQLRRLSKRLDAYYYQEKKGNISYKKIISGFFAHKAAYNYSLANTRDIESQLIDILDRIEKHLFHPTFYFVFDELDKIETPIEKRDHVPEFSNEKYLTSGGTSRKRKFTVMHLLANMKYFTTTAKAKFIFIAGREMYDGFLADLTDRESAVSSLFNGVIYVESFCKNEKSERDVMYNTETFISRQLLPQSYIEEKVVDKFVECKLKDTSYFNIDINLKLYYEYLVTTYSEVILGTKEYGIEQRKDVFDEARISIDKIIVFLYHFSAYLYHVSNGSPKKMRLTFESYVRPLRNKKEFKLTTSIFKRRPLENTDVDIHIPSSCKYLLSFSEKEQRIIGFIHYISYPVNQIITDADQFGDKLLISASYLINHIYKYHTGGFSWRNIEQTPELLEVYKIPEFRSFINYILTYLTQTHIIQIPCGLFQYKFRKQISEEISLASKISEEVSAIFNFTLDESQTVKSHYYELLNSHIKTLKDEKITSPDSLAGIHHILADLHMADEDYNNAIFEYQTALRVSNKESFPKTDDIHMASHILATIRIMLKLGLAFEKRRTISSAYNIYGEIIHILFKFRELDEKEFGLNFNIEQKVEWPNYSAILSTKKGNEKFFENVMPKIQSKPTQDTSFNEINYPLLDSSNEKIQYKIDGDDFISEFSYHLTPLKHNTIQKLSMIEDTQTIYQALLAKLFINEKIELGGITRTNIDIIENEFLYIHRTTNSKEKFLISTDFYRRLGDIMFYKNGLVGFNFTRNKLTKDIEESFFESLYYFAFDIRRELHDFCSKNKCYEYYEPMLNAINDLPDSVLKTNEEQSTFIDVEEGDIHIQIDDNIQKNIIKQLVNSFFKETIIKEKIKSLSPNDIRECNKHRKCKWIKNQTMPCLSCKFYNRSLRIMMRNLFGINIEKEKLKLIKLHGDSKTSKAIVILEQIIIGGSAKSMRTNHMIQLGEVLDCLGNTMLSCSDLSIENINLSNPQNGHHFKDTITAEFLSMFLHDVGEMNRDIDNIKLKQKYHLINKSRLELGKIETCILYYWEAYICFKYGGELKKAAGSLKKILRVFQNYLRVTSQMGNSCREMLQAKVLMGEFLNEIKNRLVKQCLISLYSHYNYINIVEIQRLKWIFYAQMYENISLNRLSLFPDVEEIMLIYYEMINICFIPDNDIAKLEPYFTDVRQNIIAYSSPEEGSIHFSWKNLEERNDDFENRLVGIYNNLSMGALRHSNTIYERILSLRFKTLLNRHILEIAFPEFKDIHNNIHQDTIDYTKYICQYLIPSVNGSCGGKEKWMRYFPSIHFLNNSDQDEDCISHRMNLLEFLIKDSLFCLTNILSTITPYTSTTLFTNSFMGNIYRDLNHWNILFDALYKYYKVFDDCSPIYTKSNKDGEKKESLFAEYDNLSKLHNFCSHCEYQSDKTACYSEQLKYYEQLSSDNKTLIDKLRNDWRSKCPYYDKKCQYKAIGYHFVQEEIKKTLSKNGVDLIEVSDLYKKLCKCNNISDRFFEMVLTTINKPNVHYTLSNYSGEMALISYRKAKQVHREGKAYKDMISKMYYLDDDLKNDTIQFDLAIERFKINSGDIDSNIKHILEYVTDPIYDIENFCSDNETKNKLEKRFPDLFWNVSEEVNLSN